MLVPARLLNIRCHVPLQFNTSKTVPSLRSKTLPFVPSTRRTFRSCSTFICSWFPRLLRGETMNPRNVPFLFLYVGGPPSPIGEPAQADRPSQSQTERRISCQYDKTGRFGAEIYPRLDSVISGE